MRKGPTNLRFTIGDLGERDTNSHELTRILARWDSARYLLISTFVPGNPAQ
jgi:hypothetical protein